MRTVVDPRCGKRESVIGTPPEMMQRDCDKRYESVVFRPCAGWICLARYGNLSG